MLQIVVLVSLESSQGGGLHQLGFMAFGVVLQKFFNNEAENFRRIGMCSWKDLDEKDLMEFIWQDLDAECWRY